MLKLTVYTFQKHFASYLGALQNLMGGLASIHGGNIGDGELKTAFLKSR